ncbi:tyrosine-type recombinase/integrase [Nocardia farcinica]|uniref:tyrosine-type recombinase/integrase n=1 Tax=Nocardia farcinica TaxID=37329 RepID=UPI002B4AECC4|nr:tyrosine-type recombinase/integrase [Nocardia farcinica]
MTILRDHRRQQLDRQLAAGKDWIDSGLVFTTAHGRPIEARNLHRTFVALLDRADLPRIRLHDLRHSCATLLFSTGADAATVQRVYGTVPSASPPAPLWRRSNQSSETPWTP